MSTFMDQAWVALCFDGVDFLFAQNKIKGATLFSKKQMADQKTRTHSHRIKWGEVDVPVLCFSGRMTLLSMMPSSRHQTAIFELLESYIAIAADNIEPFTFPDEGQLLAIPDFMRNAEYPILTHCFLTDEKPYFIVNTEEFSNFILNETEFLMEAEQQNELRLQNA